jgi:hypothetical protein
MLTGSGPRGRGHREADGVDAPDAAEERMSAGWSTPAV